MAAITIREAQDTDAAGIARIGLENSAYHVRLAPDIFRMPDEDGFVEFIANDTEWRALSTSLALVAEVDGEIAGYLEATLQEPVESARWQGQRDLGEFRLHINYVGTSDKLKRQGVGTRLVEEAEAWGRSQGAKVATLDTYINSPLSVPFWEGRMGYERQAIIFRKTLA